MAIRALVMGFGGTGAHILTYVKEQAVLKYGADADSVRFLLFDTIRDWRPGATIRLAGGAGEETTAEGQEVSLDPHHGEYYFLGDHNPNLRTYVYQLLQSGQRRDTAPHLRRWLHAPWLRDNVERAQMDIVVGAAQQRQIGRFALFQNAASIRDRIAEHVRGLAGRDQETPVNVWLVGSSAGGTGAGCLLDAAHLTRLAVGDRAVSVTGVVVLPEVYDDKPGISPGRAFSLFRELDRFQRQGIPDKDRYFVKTASVASTVRYDEHGQLRSLVHGKLFDNVFYVGKSCRGDEDRIAFFTSVASAIDPFLDENAGPPLLEKSVNMDASASAFGAARLYLPKETLAELFAWQEVQRYLLAASAFVRDGSHRRVAAGPARERSRVALNQVESLSPLFREILALDGTDEALRQFATTLQPADVVETWYGTATPELSGLDLKPDEMVSMRLTYAAPAHSWSEHRVGRVSDEERTVRTRREHQAVRRELNLPNESAEESRDRFVREVGEVMSTYKDADAPPHSFERGRRLLFKKISEHLRGKVDAAVREALEQATRFGVDPEAEASGTPLTRLYYELRHMVSEEGPLRRVEQRVALFLDALGDEEERREHEAMQSIADLKEWRPKLFGGGVDGLQGAVREAVGDYLRIYQRDRLLGDLQRVVREVRVRAEQWERLLREGLADLATRDDASARAQAETEIKRLEKRLRRLGMNPKARISADPAWDLGEPSLDLLGYRQVLEERVARDEDGRPLSSAYLSASRWSLEVDEGGRPQLFLHLPVEGGGPGIEPADFSQLHAVLYRELRGPIDQRLAGRDVFDYLEWLRKEKRVEAEDVAKLLHEEAEPLIDAQGKKTCHLVVRTAGDSGKERWIDDILKALRDQMGAQNPERVPHSDGDSISVLRVVKPQTMKDFRNVVTCRNDYLLRQSEKPTLSQGQLQELKRAQVYHAFRPELEAWYIERWRQQVEGTQLDHDELLSPRLAALLERPALFQAFVECVSTGAVEKTEELDWVWHSEDGDVPLTVEQADEDLIRAAVVFTLQRKEGSRQGLRRIELEAARRSARLRAQEDGTTVHQACQDFLASGLESLLRQIRTVEEWDLKRDRSGLRMLFTFYSTRGRRTDLERRVELQHGTSA